MSEIKDALIVVDMQNDFITGCLGTPEARAIVGRVVNKVIKYKQRKRRLFFTHDTHFDDTYLYTHEGKYLPIKHCIYGTLGREIRTEIWNEIPEGAMHINKSMFGTRRWRKYLGEGIQSVEIVGVCTDICVISNALMIRSMFPEMDITVDASCCAGTTPEKHKSALDVMKSCHIDVI